MSLTRVQKMRPKTEQVPTIPDGQLCHLKGEEEGYGDEF